MTTKARELAKLVDDSGNVDVTGTVTSDGLTVDGVAEFSGGSPQFRLTETDTTDLNNIVRVIGGNLRIESSSDDYATNKKRILVDNSTGDVSFYEDTGTTAKMVWDASAEELEIGSSTDKLELGASFQRFRKGNENKILIGNTSSALGSGTGLINYLYDPEPFIWYQGAERMRIDSSGNVGIGTASPSRPLDVYGGTIAVTSTSAFSGLQITSANNSFAYVNFGDSDDSNIGQINYNHTDNSMKFVTNNTERARIDSSGNLLVGKTSDNTSLDGVKLADNGSTFVRSNATVMFVNLQAGSSGTLVQFRRINSDVGSISVSGSTVSYNTSSDYRLKENVTSMDNASDRVLALNPCRFNFITDPDTTVDGFLAHEAQEVVPEAVTGTKDAMKTEEYEVTPAVEATYDEDGNEVTPAVEAVMGTREVPDYQGIDQSKLVPLLTKALQEALKRIEALENANGNS